MEHILTLDYIKNHWKPQVGSKKAELTVWDLASEDYKERKIPTFEDNIHLRKVTEMKMWDENSTILDVGCGAGIYSVAFAKKCRQVVGTDVSGNMIAAACENARRYETANTRFCKIDWHDFELQDEHWEKQFDLVFANMTPAVQSYHTLELLEQASRGWCYVSKPTAWKHSLTYELIHMLGREDRYRTFDIDMLCIYDVLCLKGKYPYVDYASDTWTSDIPLEKAADHYIRRIEMKQVLTSQEKQRIKEYLERKAEDGIIHDSTDVTISMMYWKV